MIVVPICQIPPNRQLNVLKSKKSISGIFFGKVFEDCNFVNHFFSSDEEEEDDDARLKEEMRGFVVEESEDDGDGSSDDGEGENGVNFYFNDVDIF